MAPQKSEGPIVAEGCGNVAPTPSVESAAGAKESPVNEEGRQLSLRLETAEEPARAGAEGGSVRGPQRPATRAEPT